MKQMKQKRKKACLKLWLTPRGLFHQVLENDSHVSALRLLEEILACVEGSDSGEVESKPADSFGCVIMKLKNGKRGMLDFKVAKHASSEQAGETARLFSSLKEALAPAPESELEESSPTCPADQGMQALSATFEQGSYFKELEAAQHAFAS